MRSRTAVHAAVAPTAKGNAGVSKGQGNNPKRRIARPGAIDRQRLEALAGALVYVGSALHKTKPGDYGFQPSTAPRPGKNVCDDLRVILRAEAERLFSVGILRGMTSVPAEGEPGPKFVWAVDESGEAYEAKVGNGGYHGYRLRHDDAMRDVVIEAWNRR